MRSIKENPSLAKAAGALGLVGHLAAAILYILVPGLIVPVPAFYAFLAAWLIILVVTIWWLRSHPWRSAGLPVAGAAVVSIALILGRDNLGWRG